jgi:phytanoyl-CoA hydroxylase
MTKSSLWLDAPDAEAQVLRRAGNNWVLRDVANALIEDGFCVIKAVHQPSLMEEVKHDYAKWLDENWEEAERHRDPRGHQFRLTNFHTASKAAMKVGKNDLVMKVLDFIFGRKAAIHTSLTFQYSTEQELHRDSPYFHTFPHGQFVGVWTALENIHPDAGPLCYVPGSHRFDVDQHKLYNEAFERLKDPAAAKHAALSEYQRLIIEKANAIGPRSYAILEKGDVAIWHPELVHGGSPAAIPSLKRQSMVFHCCPEDTFVFVEDVFLTHQSDQAPPGYYQFKDEDGRKHADFTMPGFMNSI